MTHFTLLLMRWTAVLPLSWVRGLGWLLGWILYAVVGSRRRVVMTNLRLCFPQWSEAQLRNFARETFDYFAKAWLDRGWLWHGDGFVLKKRLRLTGAVQELEGNAPTVIFAPHFVGLDAGWTAITQQLPRHFTTIYTNQANKTTDA